MKKNFFTKNTLLEILFAVTGLSEGYLASKIYDANKTLAQGIVAVALLYAFIRLYLSQENLVSYPVDKMLTIPRFWLWQLFWLPTIYLAGQIVFDSIFRLIREILYAILG